MRLPSRQSVRPGLSLLEVLVAMAIFLLSIIGISQLVSFASDRALEVQMRNQSVRLCQSKLAELKAGILPLSSQGDTPFDEDSDYRWSVTADQGTVPNLWQITVKVTREKSNGDVIESSLSQMVLDPSIVGSTQDTTPISGSDVSNPSASSSSASNSNMGSSNTPAANTPKATTPAANTTPKATTPAATTPKATTPAANTPKATTPAANSTPKTSSATPPASSDRRDVA